jgi:hypothetical protein
VFIAISAAVIGCIHLCRAQYIHGGRERITRTHALTNYGYRTYLAGDMAAWIADDA